MSTAAGGADAPLVINIGITFGDRTVTVDFALPWQTRDRAADVLRALVRSMTELAGADEAIRLEAVKRQAKNRPADAAVVGVLEWQQRLFAGDVGRLLDQLEQLVSEPGASA